MKLRADESLLAGLDGGHLLGFLAAVGTLRTAARAWPGTAPTMRWAQYDNAWRPILVVPGLTDREKLIAGLDARLKEMSAHPALAVGDDLKFTAHSFRALTLVAQDRVSADPRSAEFLAAFACETACDENGVLIDTAWRTMSGAGHQHFVKCMRDLVENTAGHHLENALFGPWRYADIGMSLRWDPQDDRRYALRWAEPSGDPTRTERGANRLALEALPIFPVQPVGSDLQTTGFTTVPRRGTFLTWPIWTSGIPLDVVLSLVALRDLQAEAPPMHELSARGVAQAFRCQRITQGKFRNFTAAVPL